MTRNVTKLHPFADSAPASRSDDPTWLSALRQDGLRRYRDAGLPTPRTEAWKYTNLRRLSRMLFQPVGSSVEDVSVPEDRLPKLDAYRAVLVNGRYRADLSRLDGMPKGVHVSGIADVLRASPAKLEPLLGRLAVHEGKPLADLNTAYLDDGFCVFIDDGAVLDKPLHLVSIGASSGTDPVCFYPRLLVSAGADCIATIVESHVGDGAYFSNGAAEIWVGAGAVLNHCKVQVEGAEAYHIADTAIHLSDRAVYDGFVFQSGGLLARNEVYASLDGEKIECRISGAYLATGKQHIDNTTFIDHVKPDCKSREVFKGVLDGTSRAVFQGKILVRKDAQKTDGFQLNKALLLSTGAEMDSKPELEIYADDVKCSHGATVGELDADALFYLRARGIDLETARNLLVAAFVDDAVGEIQNAAVREAVSEMVQAQFAMRNEDEIDE
ncbi:MAG: Fe-S cluster assembly protein SufD [Alphaproteobacteria bacterium]|nr:Fe-S cluster assembly protein SufD [Alphaproteobacteria bacterium]